MKYDRTEALRYLGAAPDDAAAGILVDTAYLKLRNEVQARHVLQRFACKVEEDGVTLAGGVRFLSTDLARHVQACTAVLLVAATLGSRVDAAIRRLTLLSVAEGAAAQAVAAALIESYCDAVQQQLDTGGLYQRPRFSPGYGDWPLQEQEKIFRLLKCPERIGLTLTAGLMMAPSKSVTAVIGLARAATQCTWQKCRLCKNNNCAYRKG